MSDENLSPAERLVREKLAKAGFDSKGAALPHGPSSGDSHRPNIKRAPKVDAGNDIPEGVITRGSEQPVQSQGLPQFPKEPVMEENLAAAAKAIPPAADKEKVIDDRFMSMEDLPSNFHPYGGRNQLLIRPFAVTELKLVARSIETGDADFITQAIDNCIDVSVLDLTIPDYFYLYYWMRIQSYPNTPHYMEWVCDENHENGVCKHENVTPLTNKELKIVYLNDLGFDPSQLDPRLDFPRVSLLQDLNIAQESKTALKEGRGKEAEFTLDDLVLVNAAKWIKEGRTLREKIAILEAQPDLELYELASKTNKAFEYGVYEYAMVNCGRCGAKRRYRVLLDAPRFFPFVD